MGMGFSAVYPKVNDEELERIKEALRDAYNQQRAAMNASYGIWDYAGITTDPQPQSTAPELIECSDGKKRTAEAKAEWEAHIWEQIKLAVGT